MEQLKILLVAATPERSTSKQAGPDESDAAREMRNIDEVLAAASDGACVDVCTLQAATWQRLHDALLRHRPHVVHIIAQGAPRAIELENDDRLAETVDAGELAELVRTFPDIQLMIFSACHSVETADITMSKRGCAIGFQGTVTPADTIQFAQAFYRNLGSGETIDAAFERARALTARCTPVLICAQDLARRRLLPPSKAGANSSSPPRSGDRHVRHRPAFRIGAALLSLSLLAGAAIYLREDERPGFECLLVVEQEQPDGSKAPYSSATLPSIEHGLAELVVADHPTGASYRLLAAKLPDELVVAFPRAGCSPSRVSLSAELLSLDPKSPLSILIPNCAAESASCPIPRKAGEATMHSVPAASRCGDADTVLSLGVALDLRPIECDDLMLFCHYVGCGSVQRSEAATLCDSNSWSRPWPSSPDTELMVAMSSDGELAERFCAWRGGRLPTTDEWDSAYSAAEGTLLTIPFHFTSLLGLDESSHRDLPWREWVRTTSGGWAYRQEFAGNPAHRVAAVEVVSPQLDSSIMTWRCAYEETALEQPRHE